LLCCQLGLNELLVASSGVDGEPLLFGYARVRGTRFDTRPGEASIRNRGNNEHSIPPCQKRFGTRSGARLRGKNGALTENYQSIADSLWCNDRDLRSSDPTSPSGQASHSHLDVRVALMLTPAT
jgi:hypothetical protein